MPNKHSIWQDMSDWLGQMKTGDDAVQRDIYESWKTWINDVGVKAAGLSNITQALKYTGEFAAVSDWLRDQLKTSQHDELNEIKARLDALEAQIKAQTQSDGSTDEPQTSS